jgi:hypothetical protein
LLTGLLDCWRLHKNHIFAIVIISLDNKSRFFVRYISYFILNLINNPEFENINTSILNRILLLKTKYSSADQTIDLLLLGYLE